MSTLLVPESELQGAAAVARHRSKSKRLRASDPAVGAMTDFFRDPPQTTAEDVDLDCALDDMFRLGVRAFLVVRHLTVVGMITAEDIRQARCNGATRVLEVMIEASDMPAIDWHTLRDSTVGDLIEIFEGANVHHLVVLETESTQRLTVRGLVHRSRLERRLELAGPDL
ncbi:MAG TPA: CBS domain-containing protein [Steroidobacteraceae bacterium]